MSQYLEFYGSFHLGAQRLVLYYFCGFPMLSIITLENRENGMIQVSIITLENRENGMIQVSIITLENRENGMIQVS